MLSRHHWSLEVLRQHVWKENDAFKGRIYTDEEEREAALNFLKNRYVPPEEPFTEVVSKAKKKNMKKGIHVHNTRSRGQISVVTLVISFCSVCFLLFRFLPYLFSVFFVDFA